MPTLYIETPLDRDPQRWDRCLSNAKRTLAAKWQGSPHSHKFSDKVTRMAVAEFYRGK